jgi:hypothetical protein
MNIPDWLWQNVQTISLERNMTSLPLWLQTVGVIAGVLGMITGVGSLLLRLNDRKVSLSIEGDIRHNYTEPTLFLTVKNTGQREATISKMVLLPESGGREIDIGRHMAGGGNLPSTIPSGGKFDVRATLPYMLRTLKALGYSEPLTFTPVVEDALGNRYTAASTFTIPQG